jgi:signal transduction histidine kinase
MPVEMGHKSKTASGASQSFAGEAVAADTPDAAQSRACAETAGELQALSAEIVALLNEQAFSDASQTERGVCESFSNVLLRHWSLCCVAVFLRGEDGALRACTSASHDHASDEGARRAAAAMAEEVARTGREFGAGVEGESESVASAGLRDAFERAGLGAGVAVPIRASGTLAGALVVASRDASRVRSSLAGVRCVAQAVAIALGNARRGAAMGEQHSRIESLVEELRRQTVELEEANLELQRVGRYRSLFLQRMSHELRTPLTSILGFAEILLDQERLTDAQRRFCEIIQSAGFQLQASLNQLVDLSRLEAGQTEIFLHEFSLRETLRESCAAVARLAQKQGVTLDCTTAPDIGSVVSDEGKLRQVLYNFFAFGIGRSPAGATIKITASPAGAGRIRVEIRDEGEPLEDPARLFLPVDVDAPNERGTNMNELGLVIAHRLLGLLGGSVTLHDQKPKGLAVRLNLPTRPAGK